MAPKSRSSEAAACAGAEQEQCTACPQEQRSRSRSSPSWLFLAVVVTLAMLGHGPGYCWASSVDEQSSDASASLSKEEPQLSATAGLVKRAAPAHSAAYGHSIMRFGRAPHNIMHFGKRGGVADSFDSAYQAEESQVDSSAEVSSVPEWILANYLSKAAAQPQHESKLVTKYLLVPVQVRAQDSPAAILPPAIKNYGPAPAKKARAFGEQDDNIFMHFGK